VSGSSPRFRSILDKFSPYRPGRSPAGPDGKSFKLSSNESPFGPLPSVVETIAAAAGQVNRYPDNGAEALTDAIAARFAVPGLIVTTRKIAARVRSWTTSCDTGARLDRVPDAVIGPPSLVEPR